MKQNLFLEKNVKFASILFGLGVLIFLAFGVMELMKISLPNWVNTVMSFISGTFICVGCLWHFVFGIISFRADVKNMPSYSDERKTKKIEAWLYCYTFFLVFVVIVAVSLTPSHRSVDPTDKQIAQIIGLGMQVLLGVFFLVFIRCLIRKTTEEIRLRQERRYVK